MYFPDLSEGVLFTMEFQEVIYWQCAIPCCYEWLFTLPTGVSSHKFAIS